MNDLRTAAQQALEALEDLADCGAEAWSEQRPCVQIGREAITALRAALAQQAEPVEPVAWMLPGSDSIITAETKAYRGMLAENWTLPLYAAPPQRKPLTLEEIYHATGHCGVSKYTAINIARAIERAHGIKE